MRATTLQAPPPSGSAGLLNQIDAILSTGSDAEKVELLAQSGGAFTKDGLEVKNQERVKAFDTGPVFPIGGSGGTGANTLKPFDLAPANRERLNAGEVVRPPLGAPRVTALGNAFGDVVNASNWAEMAAAQTQSANIDTAGFAQTVATGNFIPARPSTYDPVRGWLKDGGLSYLDTNPNAGAGFSAADGAAGGAVANVALASAASAPPASAAPPSGAGALETPDAYGLAALLSSA